MMREIPILPGLLAVALLAGCGERTSADQNGIVDAAANVSAAPAAAGQDLPPANSSEPAIPSSPGTGKTIPATLLGVYDSSLEACAKPSDGRLTLSATELRFHESIGTVLRATVTGLDKVTVEADYQGEGESWRSTRELQLSDGGAILTISGDGTRLVRVRCPAASR